MRYTIVHTTNYHYTSPVYESFNEVRLNPLSDASQMCLGFTLAVDPPATLFSYHDYYGNTVHDFGIPYLHDSLTIEATSEVVTFAGLEDPASGPRPGEPDTSPTVASLADAQFADDHSEFLTPTTYISFDETIRDLADSLLAVQHDQTALAYLFSASNRVHESLEYKIGATTVHSTVADVLEGGSGVCQDFAHVLIALCRLVGLPARYVSGYLGDIAESAASHAWAETFVPPFGWVGMDATGGTICTGRHVKVAVGRDYADVAVVRGTYRGGEAETLNVSVSGQVIGDTHTLAAAPSTRRGELIQYQSVGSLRQFQRLGQLSQSMASHSKQARNPTPDEEFLPTSLSEFGEAGAPRQQPQQQQQTATRRFPPPARLKNR